MTRDESQNTLNDRVTEEIETDGPDRDQEHAPDHGIDVAAPDVVKDRHMPAKNWSIIDCKYVFAFFGNAIYILKHKHTLPSLTHNIFVEAQFSLNAF